VSTVAVVAVLALCVAQGAAIDVSAESGGRVTLAGSDEGPAPTLALSLQPAVQAALESENAIADARYRPQLSGVLPSERLLLVLHSASAGGEWRVTPRTVLRARTIAVIGDLDPGSAQRELFANLVAFDGSRALSYANGTVEVGLGWRAHRRVQLDLAASLGGVGSPFADPESSALLPASRSAILAGRTTLLWTRTTNHL
jgi:hypothetical protein